MTNKVQTAFYFEGSGDRESKLADSIGKVLEYINHNRTSDEVAKAALNVLLKSFENSNVYTHVNGCSASFNTTKEDEPLPDELDNNEEDEGDS